MATALRFFEGAILEGLFPAQKDHAGSVCRIKKREEEKSEGKFIDCRLAFDAKILTGASEASNPGSYHVMQPLYLIIFLLSDRVSVSEMILVNRLSG